MGCTPSKEDSANVQEPIVSKSVDAKMTSNVQEDAAENSGSSALASSNIIFVLGGPGSGKGTQCDKILKKYTGVHHFSAGDLLRDAVKAGNTDLEAIMKEGKLVPMEVTIGLLKDAMVKSGGSVFLIDGFPRALDQAEAFESQIKPCDMVLAFDCPEGVMRERLLARGQTSGRADDNEETIVKRFRTFVEQSKPVIERYKTEGKCAEISAVDTPDSVFEKVTAAISVRLPELPVQDAEAPPPAAAEVAPAPEAQPAAQAASAVEASLPEDSKIIFVLGGPGSGKGTQCAKILEEYSDCDVHHFSAGDLLREAVKNGNTELEAIMKEGKLVPMEVTIGLLKDAMIKSGGRTFLIDGFPRALDQAAAFESGIKPCFAVLFFDCSEEVMRERLLARGETSGRADDNEETIVKRFRTFVEQSKPVVEEFKSQGKCYDISSMQAPDDVFAEVKAALDATLRGGAAPAPAPEAEAPPAEQAEPVADLPEGSKIIFVLGGPGSGKGTQCDKIISTYDGVHHFSAGDLLRDAVKNGNTELEEIMKEGKLVPMETTIGLLKGAMVACGGRTFLIDGFPRAMDQAQAFESSIQPCTAVLFFDCSEEVMRSRLLARGETSGRADDNEETIVKRFRTFVEQSKPVVEEFAKEGKVFSISSEQTPDDVFAEVKSALDSVLTPAEVAA